MLPMWKCCQFQFPIPNWSLATLETGNIGNTGNIGKPPQFINNFSAGTMKSK